MLTLGSLKAPLQIFLAIAAAATATAAVITATALTA